MSCSKQCFDEANPFYQHVCCQTCPGQDSGRSKDDKKYCAACHDWHDVSEWPHKPAKEQVVA